MIQYTTPTFILTLPETVDLSLVQNLYFSLTQGKTEIVKTGSALVVEGQTVSVYLSQDETKLFNSGKASLQLNWTYANGSRACSTIVAVDVGRNLLDEVVV